MDIHKTTAALRVIDSNRAGSSFGDVDLSESMIDDARLSRVRFSDVEIRDRNLAGTSIHGIAVADLLSAYDANTSGARTK